MCTVRIFILIVFLLNLFCLKDIDDFPAKRLIFIHWKQKQNGNCIKRNFAKKRTQEKNQTNQTKPIIWAVICSPNSKYKDQISTKHIMYTNIMKILCRNFHLRRIDITAVRPHMRIGYVRRALGEFSSLLKSNYDYLLISTSNSATLVSAIYSSSFDCTRML